MSTPPTDITLKRADNGSLLLVQAGKETPVRVRRCFPWREPGRFISLCDKDGKEAALIVDPAGLGADSRARLEEAMALAGFTLRIRKVLDVKDEIELRTWKVDVDGAVRSFQTELDEWPRTLPGGRVVIKDVSGDLYTIENPDVLDTKSRRLLWALSG